MINTKEIKYETQESNPSLKIKCHHGNIITVESEPQGEYWENGAKLTLQGCEECARENKIDHLWQRRKYNIESHIN